jgi:hypothetical protein
MQWCEPFTHSLLHSFTSSLIHFFTHSLQPNDSKYFGFNQPGIKKIGRIPSLIPIKTRNLSQKYGGEWEGIQIRQSLLRFPEPL